MVRLLLANRADVFHDYTEASFESALSRRFVITDRVETRNGFRTLFLVDPKGRA